MKGVSIFSSGGHFVQQSGTILAFLVEDYPKEHFCEIIVKSVHWSRRRGPGFVTWSGHILLFLLPLIQVEKLSVTGESICTKYRLTA